MVGAANAESAPGPTESSPKVGSSGDIETVDPLAKLVNTNTRRILFIAMQGDTWYTLAIA